MRSIAKTGDARAPCGFGADAAVLDHHAVLRCTTEGTGCMQPQVGRGFRRAQRLPRVDMAPEARQEPVLPQRDHLLVRRTVRTDSIGHARRIQRI